MFPFVSKTASSQELKSIVLAVWLKEEEEMTAMDDLELRVPLCSVVLVMLPTGFNAGHLAML